MSGSAGTAGGAGTAACRAREGPALQVGTWGRAGGGEAWDGPPPTQPGRSLPRGCPFLGSGEACGPGASQPVPCVQSVPSRPSSRVQRCVCRAPPRAPALSFAALRAGTGTAAGASTGCTCLRAGPALSRHRATSPKLLPCLTRLPSPTPLQPPAFLLATKGLGPTSSLYKERLSRRPPRAPLQRVKTGVVASRLTCLSQTHTSHDGDKVMKKSQGPC